jgi:hypothetical protein
MQYSNYYWHIASLTHETTAFALKGVFRQILIRNKNWEKFCKKMNIFAKLTLRYDFYRPLKFMLPDFL